MIEPKEHLKTIQRITFKEPSRMFKHRLDRNERNQPFSDKFIKTIKNKINGELFMVYPELDKVYERLAAWLGIDTNCLMLHSGSEQAIKNVFETYISSGEQILLHFPGFAMYQVYCKMFQAEVVGQYYDSDLNFVWDDYVEKINENLRMVVVENPNGFLGNVLPLKELVNLIDKAHKHNTIALVDEAYFHFHDETVIDLIEKYNNLIISRTFSKAFGLAGPRVGYLISQPTNIEYLKKVRPAYELSSVSALLVLEILDNIDEVSFYVNDTKKNLAALRGGLSALAIITSDSKANFVVAKLGEERIHNELRKALYKQNILIRRPFREKILKEWIRISTAPKEIQDILLKELKKILTK